MNFELECDGARAALSGELTIGTVAEIKQRLAQFSCEQGEREIDLSGVTDIDTAGLQLMLLSKKIPGTTIRFVRHSAPVLRMIDLANVGCTLGDPLLLSAGAAA